MLSWLSGTDVLSGPNGVSPESLMYTVGEVQVECNSLFPGGHRKLQVGVAPIQP
jgi:hypothetical protein